MTIHSLTTYGSLLEKPSFPPARQSQTGAVADLRLGAPTADGHLGNVQRHPVNADDH